MTSVTARVTWESCCGVGEGGRKGGSRKEESIRPDLTFDYCHKSMRNSPVEVCDLHAEGVGACGALADRRAVNSEHIRQSKPDSGLDSPVQVIKIFSGLVFL